MTDDDLRAEIVALRNRLADLEQRLDEPDAPPEPEHRSPRVSRRGLLTAAVAGGAGLIATQVTTAAHAAAAPGGNVVLGAFNDAGGSLTIVTSSVGANASPFAVTNPNNQGLGLYAQLGAKTGRFAPNAGHRAAVIGEAAAASGVVGVATTASGVLGDSDQGAGVRGQSLRYYGVHGVSEQLDGVVGTSQQRVGVVGYSFGTQGVLGVCDAGTGVEGRSVHETGVAASSASGVAVVADADGTGAGVAATSKSGYGVLATGGRAPLRLTPSTTTGAPKKDLHKAGELYVDKLGVLYYCIANGTPGTWKKVVLA